MRAPRPSERDMHAPSDVFISCVVPAYNEEALIGDTLDSLLHAVEATGHPISAKPLIDAAKAGLEYFADGGPAVSE